MKTIKSTILIFLGCLVLLSYTTSAFAQNFEDEDNRACVHEWEIHSYNFQYVSYNNTQHALTFNVYRVCKKCGLRQEGGQNTLYEPHNFNYSYNGNNYHTGTKHFFQYNVTCECGYSGGPIWRSGYCPGGNNHIQPLSILPIEPEIE